jgi:hypothetical protein
MRFHFVSILSLAVCGMFSTLLDASESKVIKIEIKSSWDGLGTPSKSMLVITGAGKKYFANRKAIDENDVQALITALQKPSVKQPSIEECGITSRWLRENAKRGLEAYTHQKIGNLTPRQVKLFKEHFTNPADIQAAFEGLLQELHTDDYPEMSVTVYESGRRFGIQSQSQNAFMLPWLGMDSVRGGYSCEISKAIATLLPKSFSNKERLILGQGFRWQLTERVMRDIEHEWNMLDTEFKVGPAVAPILAHYTLVESAISNLSSIDVDGRQAWNAQLRSSDLPSNALLGVSLRYHKKNELEGVDELLTRLPKYSRLVLSVPCLTEYMTAHPDATAELRYVDGRSLSMKAQASLIQDMRDHGRPELADAVAHHGAESAFLEINGGNQCWSRVIVLPSREVIIWHFKCDSVLGFPARDFKTWDYYGWRSVGAVVKEDGTLENQLNFQSPRD